MMKAAVLAAPDALPVYRDFPEPVVEPGRELVELVAAGIHPAVRSVAGGEHYSSTATWPVVPGLDAVARAADGTLIYTGFVAAPYGTFAQRMAVPAVMRFPLPAGADPLLVAAAMNPGMASWLPLQSRLSQLADTGLGTVLILGATGSAGQLAVQNARGLGAKRVVAVGRDRARLASLDALGAATVRLSGDPDTDAATILAGLDGSDPSVVLDFVWGPVAEIAFAALSRPRMRDDGVETAYVQIGASAREHAAVPAAALRARRIHIRGSGAGSTGLGDVLRQLPRYLDLIASRRVTVPVRARPLTQIAQAWAESSTATERIVITAPPDEAASSSTRV